MTDRRIAVTLPTRFLMRCPLTDIFGTRALLSNALAGPDSKAGERGSTPGNPCNGRCRSVSSNRDPHFPPWDDPLSLLGCQSLAVVNDLRVRAIASVSMFRVPATIRKLIGDLCVAPFDMLSLSRGLGCDKSRVVVGEGLRPDIAQAIPVTAIVLADMICDRGHYGFLLRIRIPVRVRWPCSNAN